MINAVPSQNRGKKRKRTNQMRDSISQARSFKHPRLHGNSSVFGHRSLRHKLTVTDVKLDEAGTVSSLVDLSDIEDEEDDEEDDEIADEASNRSFSSLQNCGITNMTHDQAVVINALNSENEEGKAQQPEAREERQPGSKLDEMLPLDTLRHSRSCKL